MYQLRALLSVVSLAFLTMSCARITASNVDRWEAGGDVDGEEEGMSDLSAIFDELDATLADERDPGRRTRARRDALRAAEDQVRATPELFAEYQAYRSAIYSDPAAIADAETYRAALAQEHGGFRPTQDDIALARRVRAAMGQTSPQPEIGQ